jgi:alpha-L-fucosidase
LLPSASQLAYQKQEIVALTHFNMATFYHDGDPACDKSNWDTSQKPSSFAPSNLNISNWIESYKAVGCKSGILTAKHGCGFLLWPAKVTLPDGSNYGYHVGGKGGIGKDIVAMYAAAMKDAGLPHSFYYSLKDSFLMNAKGDNVQDPKTLLPGQVQVTQDQFENISIAAVTELWTNYGDLAEIWFDGGISDRIKDRIVPLMQKLQPNAIAMGAGIKNNRNDVDWVGTESGMPKYPVWSTGCTNPGGGSTGVAPDKATGFCPKCGDCTLQSPDHWFWMPNTPIKVRAYHTHM